MPSTRGVTPVKAGGRDESERSRSERYVFFRFPSPCRGLVSSSAFLSGIGKERGKERGRLRLLIRPMNHTRQYEMWNESTRHSWTAEKCLCTISRSKQGHLEGNQAPHRTEPIRRYVLQLESTRGSGQSTRTIILQRNWSRV